MSWLSARLFSWIQGAAFYADLHAEAVHGLPFGDGRTWLDVGTGPGLVARLASERGYRTLGIDRDPAMVSVARAHAHSGVCRFEVGELGGRLDVGQLAPGTAERPSADVVSAASLLFVLPNPREGLAQLWACVRPGGTLLIVETTEHMTPLRARAIAPELRPGRRSALALWARARSGRALDPALFDQLDASTRSVRPLLHGLVQAWTFEKPNLRGTTSHGRT
jgi:SAM-dependent methyltransferase